MAKAIMLSSNDGNALFELFLSLELSVAMDTTLEFSNFIDSLALDTSYIYIIDITNNTNTSQYKGLYALFDRSKAFSRPANLVTNISTTYEFHVTVGAVINIWRKLR